MNTLMNKLICDFCVAPLQQQQRRNQKKRKFGGAEDEGEGGGCVLPFLTDMAIREKT